MTEPRRRIGAAAALHCRPAAQLAGAEHQQGGARPITLDWHTAFDRLDGAFAPRTIRSYRTDVQIFVTWCEQRAVCPLPASIATVCSFLEDQAVSVCASSVRRRLYAVRKVHRLLGLADPTHDEAIGITIRRVRRSQLNSPQQAKGLTRPMLDACLAAMPDTPWGLRNRAMLSLGYDLLTRRSELLALNSDDAVARPDGTLRVLIRRSKTDPYGMGRIAFSSARSAGLVARWLAWRGPGIEPLFCGIYHGKPIYRALSPTHLRDILKVAVASAGASAADVVRYSGHSLRVGAAQDLLCAGFDTAAIMRAGGWKSVNVLARYLEFAEHNVWAV